MVEIHREYYSNCLRYSLIDDNREVGRAYLYLIRNSLHNRCYGLLEDLYVDPSYRKQGYAKQIIKCILDDCKYNRCYKLIATSRLSRNKVHKFYKDIGFKKHGYEYRIDF
jgi:GNAT superfamily N-acetyltransferase